MQKPDGDNDKRENHGTIIDAAISKSKRQFGSRYKQNNGSQPLSMLLAEQIEAADLVVLNKTDLVDTGTKQPFVAP